MVDGRVATLLLALACAVSIGACEEGERDDAPLITTDRVRPHVDRGHCAACHIVTPAAGAVARAAPRIGANQVRPHPDRGACTACHAVVRSHRL